MDYFIIVVTTVAGLYFHGWLYVRIKRWMDRDLALALAGKDERKKRSCSSNWQTLECKRSSVEICRNGWKPLRQAIPISRLLRVPDAQASSRRPASDSSGGRASD